MLICLPASTNPKVSLEDTFTLQLFLLHSRLLERNKRHFNFLGGAKNISEVISTSKRAGELTARLRLVLGDKSNYS